MAKNLPDPSRRSFITRLTKSFLEMARELNTLAEEWQGRGTSPIVPPAENRQPPQEEWAAINTLLSLPAYHLIYLLTFDPPRPIDKAVPLPASLSGTDWATSLGEDPMAATNQFQVMGALVRADLQTHIAARDFTRAELQAMLRARQLPISGNKEELVERLIQADEPGLWTALDGLILWECAPWAWYTAKMRLDEVLSSPVQANECQTSQPDPMREAIKWILAAAAGGVIGNRADDVVMALVDSIRAQNVHADSASPMIDVPSSPLPTPENSAPVPEPLPEPDPQSTPRPRSTPIPPLAFDWVTIPAGEFWMGSDKDKDPLAYDDETPQHKVYLPTYRIARYPVTVAQFAQFSKATGYQTVAEKEGWAYSWSGSSWQQIKGAYWAHPRGPESDVQNKANHPVTCVSWVDVNEFCRWAGVRLASEAEWEKAARGTDGRIYPWGNELPDKERCNFNMDVGDTTAVGSYAKGKSPYGVLDMAGNVWEWTSSLYKNYPYKSDDGREDPADAGRRVVRGGSFVDLQNLVRSACRYHNFIDSRSLNVGFRVVAPGS
jgi:sulfatase modifying factor 1